METEPPQPDNSRPGRRRVVVAVLCAVVGLILVAFAVISLAAGEITGRRALATALPGALLIVGSLIAAAAPDPESGRRFGFRVGFAVGWLVGRWRSLFGPHRDGQ